MGLAVAQFVILTALVRGASPADTTTYVDRVTNAVVTPIVLLAAPGNNWDGSR